MLSCGSCLDRKLIPTSQLAHSPWLKQVTHEEPVERSEASPSLLSKDSMQDLLKTEDRRSFR